MKKVFIIALCSYLRCTSIQSMQHDALEVVNTYLTIKALAKKSDNPAIVVRAVLQKLFNSEYDVTPEIKNLFAKAHISETSNYYLTEPAINILKQTHILTDNGHFKNPKALIKVLHNEEWVKEIIRCHVPKSEEEIWTYNARLYNHDVMEWKPRIVNVFPAHPYY